MSAKFDDQQIGRLINEKKPLPTDYLLRLRLKTKRGHRESQLDILGSGGNRFRIILRSSDYNTIDFSAILAYLVPNSNRVFRLRRYNGKSHEHTNIIEDERFFSFHIHKATERYQNMGRSEDAYAVQSEKFNDLNGAVSLMFGQCNFRLPAGFQLGLFGRFLNNGW